MDGLIGPVVTEEHRARVRSLSRWQKYMAFEKAKWLAGEDCPLSTNEMNGPAFGQCAGGTPGFDIHLAILEWLDCDCSAR